VAEDRETKLIFGRLNKKAKENNKFRQRLSDMVGVVLVPRVRVRRVSRKLTCSIQSEGYNPNLSVNINIDYFTYANGDER
jgi:hypothetical protein